MTSAAVAETRPETRVGARRREGLVIGQPDMWAVLLFEYVFFSSYFIIYMLYRMRTPKLFLRSQEHLNQHLGFANTIILLTSSWLIARCVQSARDERYEVALRQV